MVIAFIENHLYKILLDIYNFDSSYVSDVNKCNWKLYLINITVGNSNI